MPKTVAAAALPGTSGTAVATVRKRTKAIGTSTSKPVKSVAAKQIDPKVRTAIKKAGSDPLVVMVKFDTKGSDFGQHPVTNRAGGARERAFNKEVEAEVEKTAAEGKYRIVSVAANIGVATVEASAGIVRSLIASSKIAGMKLKV